MGGGAQELKIPDWRMYRVEGCAKLEDVQRKLAAKGLRDPWLRNEAWRYTKPVYTPRWTLAINTISWGFKWGALGVALTIAADKAFNLGIATGGHHGDDHH